ncbi:MAG: PAS-domain containing protein, partial [Rhodocyclaceae bacterium]|nr:PAS-domain containing protein [Rhodocyclaceae bacterium]
MMPPVDLRAAPNDTAGLLKEIQRRDKIIDALTYQVEQNLSDQGRDYGLLQTTFVLEDQVRQRTEELTNTLTTLGEVMAEATAARKQLETAVETSSDGFALFDSERRVLLCNQAFRRLWGLTGLTQHKTLAELLSAAAPAGEPPSALLAQLEACRDGRGWGQVELPGGQSLRVRERRIDDGCTVAIYSDVTDLKAEAARQRQQELARKSRLLQSTL